MAQVLALLAGGLAGKTQRDRDNREEERRKADDAWRDEQRNRTRMQWQRDDQKWQAEQADTEAARGAMAPVKAQPTLGPDEHGPPAFSVAGKSYGPDQVDPALEAANALPTRMSRAAAAVQNPETAMRYQGAAQQAEVSAMQLRAAKLREADDAFNRDIISRATDWDSLTGFINESKGDGRGGALKVKFQPSADGKTVQALTINPDGTTTATPFTFPNSPEGLQQAVGVIGMRLPADQKLAHLQGMARTAEERRRWEVERGDKDRDFKLREKEADSRAALRAAQAEATAARAEAAMARAAAAAAGRGAAGETQQPTAPRVSMAEIDKIINPLFSTKDEMTGKANFDPNGAQFVRTLALRMPAAQLGDSQGAANQALAIYQAALARPDVKGNHDKAVQAITASAMGGNSGATVTPGTPAPSPDALPRRAPAPAPAPAAPRAEPGSAANPTGDKVLNDLVQRRGAGAMEALQPQVEQLRQAQAVLVVVGRSGDPVAINRAAAEVTRLRGQIESVARQKLGPQAETFLSQL